MQTKETTIPAQTQMVNEMRLSWRHWLVVLCVVLVGVFATPPVWKAIERFDTGTDYRIPYNLSKDYWLAERRLEKDATPEKIVMLGDSVIWGEYVLPDGTWAHFLNQRSGGSNVFINAGINGLFPLALEGLVDDYGRSLKHRKIILHCNLLWLSNPKADLSAQKEEKFNHVRLVPQFTPRIPCYKADTAERLGVEVEHNVAFLAWVNHLQNAYFEQKSILAWTLADDGNDPPHYTNWWKNPLAQIHLTVPSAPADDPQRGPQSPRHKAWNEAGNGPTQFEWVGLDASLQWGAFQRIVNTLQQRGNDVYVILGPFNEHMVAKESRPAYDKIRSGILKWLDEKKIPHFAPDPLPSALYADASHPLTRGYDQLAKEVLENGDFQKWMGAAKTSAN